MYVDANTRKKILALKDIVVPNFTEEHWLELGTLTGCYEIVRQHSRLLRSLSFDDTDYPANALTVLMHMVERETVNYSEIESYVHSRFGGGGVSVSSKETSGPRVYFQPTVFDIPKTDPDPRLVSAMMPFSSGFDGTYQAIQAACQINGLTCERADNIWKESAVIQDIFGLIYRSHIVVCDFTGKNPNVFYEAGIAHTLGKHVIPITQSQDDIPFDLRHHRYLGYLNNGEGLQRLQSGLADRLRTLDQNRFVTT